MTSNAIKILCGVVKNSAINLPLVALVAIAMVAEVRADDNALIKQEFNTTFEQVLADPSDLDATLKYADLAVALKDYEAAIPALERVLFFNPDLVEIKLELGVMYYNLKSYDVARSYFNDAKSSPLATEDVISEADGYLTRMGG